jgi:anti-sigma B factor antagonist
MSRDVEQGGQRGAATGRAWFEMEELAGWAVVRAGGEIDTQTVHEFHETVTRATSRASRVVLDLAGVTFVDSSGLGALIVARNSARESGGSLSLVSPPPVVRRLLGSTRLHDVFDIYDTLDEATNAFQRP